MGEIRLHRGLYGEEAIRKAVASFAASAEISVRGEGEHLIVSWRSPDPLLDGLIGVEIANHALTLAVARSGE